MESDPLESEFTMGGVAAMVLQIVLGILFILVVAFLVKIAVVFDRKQRDLTKNDAESGQDERENNPNGSVKVRFDYPAELLRNPRYERFGMCGVWMKAVHNYCMRSNIKCEDCPIELSCEWLLEDFCLAAGIPLEKNEEVNKPP